MGCYLSYTVDIYQPEEIIVNDFIINSQLSLNNIKIKSELLEEEISKDFFENKQEEKNPTNL
jgi:hypothetical protein